MDSSRGNDAVAWLAAAAPDPAACRREWERSAGGVVLLPAGRRWDLLRVPARLGLPALRVLTDAPVARGSGRLPGPVLTDPGDDTVGYLVPVGTAARWVGTGVHGAGAGAWVAIPHPARRSRGLRWLLAPDGSGRLTDPAALELALHEAAAGSGGPWGPR
ncbi:hypothetical protein C7C46_15025 [Streptomyces tateyamensis]|uniref:DNA primase/polymerase bifunctional N-terminal domain-containing protein n=1 Tax=Streptomyces tateyamensis TaxID=565073 RepID=A0A2V4NS35_9ACTN|nr:hypothetical protein [Streptomyces tateyamensis]PYC79173.1 hypothetical protein C7C46_15025 [Streptomyces tateyamensis]